MEPEIIIIAAIVFGAYTAQTIAGFGGMILSLTFGAQVFTIAELLPILLPVSVAQTSVILATQWRHVQWSMVLGRIIPLMAAGTAGGLVVARLAPPRPIEIVFAVLVIVLASRELYLLFRRQETKDKALSPAASSVALLSAGITHGIYATGGPLLVYAVGKSGMDKSQFRASVSTVFFLLNVALCATYVASGRLASEQLPAIGALLPVLFLSLVVGQWAHHRIQPRPFRIVVFSMLLLAGFALL